MPALPRRHADRQSAYARRADDPPRFINLRRKDAREALVGEDPVLECIDDGLKPDRLKPDRPKRRLRQQRRSQRLFAFNRSPVWSGPEQSMLAGHVLRNESGRSTNFFSSDLAWDT